LLSRLLVVVEAEVGYELFSHDHAKRVLQLHLHWVPEPAEVVDVVPALLCGAPGRVVIDLADVRDVPVEAGLLLGSEYGI
jgi:hypothetical protein